MAHQESTFIVKNTFIDQAEPTKDVQGSRRRANSVPAISPTNREFPEAVKACLVSRGPPSESTGCSESEASSEDWEDPVLEALPPDVRGGVLQAIEVVNRQVIESAVCWECELEMDDEEDEDCKVRVTFYAPQLTESEMLPSVHKALLAELGLEKLMEHNSGFRLVLGGPFRRTLVDLAFVAA